jgi:hypothetical protein
MSEMVERVAAAIMASPGGTYDAARAAITAMREPTDEQRNEFFRLKKAAGNTDLGASFVDAARSRTKPRRRLPKSLRNSIGIRSAMIVSPTSSRQSIRISSP